MNTDTTSVDMEQHAPNPSFIERVAKSPGATEYLTNTIDCIGQYLDMASAIPSINLLCEVLLQAPYVDMNDDVNKVHLRSLLHLTTFLTELRINYETLIIETDE